MPNITIKNVPDALTDSFSPAAYFVSPIDETKEEVIYLNQAYINDYNYIYTTLAHEGYPGHLYQNVYTKSLDINNVRKVIKCNGYVEGWATYVEIIAYSFSKSYQSAEALRIASEYLALDNKFNLIVNALFDLCIHYKGMSLEELTNFLNQLLGGEYTEDNLANPTDERLFHMYSAIKDGRSVEELAELSKMDAFFLYKIENIVEFEKQVTKEALEDEKFLLKAKKLGFSNFTLAKLAGINEEDVKALLDKFDIKPSYKMVDTCAAEFEAKTPYYYSSYDKGNELIKTDNKKILIIGAGPIRIGQGIEFDYCCVHSSLALKDQGIETILVNNNPETVSTDYDISDELFFEPLTFEDIMGIIEQVEPEGVIVQFGGQTSINLSVPLAKAGVKIFGTPYESIDRVEDRERFTEVLNDLNIRQAPYGLANSFDEAREAAERIGFPVLVRPSYVIGGRAMEIVYCVEELEEYMNYVEKCAESGFKVIEKKIEESNGDNELIERKMLKELDLLYMVNVENDI